MIAFPMGTKLVVPAPFTSILNGIELREMANKSLAHLLLMRTDEHYFWRKCNQHRSRRRSPAYDAMIRQSQAEKQQMAKRRNKAAKIRAALAEQPDATAKEIVATLAAQRVRVTTAQVYNVKATNGKPKRNGYDSLIQAKRLADAMGGVDKARAALDALAKLL